jgi:LemA protein
MANEAWSGIDVQLKRRAELVPNLVETVKGYASHERGVLDEVTRLRGAARAVPEGDVAARAQAEGALSGALGRLFALSENYPDLKASANFLGLQQQLSDLENELQMARRFYNGAVRNLNVLVQSFPGNLIAGAFGFSPRDFFELDDAGERNAPQVSLAPR